MVARASALALACALACAALCGCRAHVLLDQPPVGAPRDARTAYYDSHRPLPAERGQLDVHTPLGQKRPEVFLRSVQLSNGTVIPFIEDALPLVEAKSATAQAAADAVDARGRAQLLTGAGGAVAAVFGVAGAVLVGSATGLFPGVVPIPQNGGNNTQSVVTGLGVAGIATLAVGGAAAGGLFAFGTLVQDDAARAATRGFRALDADLRAKLQLGDEAAVPSAPASGPSGG